MRGSYHVLLQMVKHFHSVETFHDTEKKFLHIDIELKIKQARPNYDFEQVHEIFFFLRLTLKSVSDGEKWN